MRVLIITGSGAKAFVAGADIKEFADFSTADGKALSADGHAKLFTHVERMSKPVIAAVNGFALGGGLELAMSCHFRIASDTARMGLPEVTLGVIPHLLSHQVNVKEHKTICCLPGVYHSIRSNQFLVSC